MNFIFLFSLSRAGIDDGTSCSGTDFGTLDSRPGAQYQSHMDGYWEWVFNFKPT